MRSLLLTFAVLATLGAAAWLGWVAREPSSEADSHGDRAPAASSGDSEAPTVVSEDVVRLREALDAIGELNERRKAAKDLPSEPWSPHLEKLESSLDSFFGGDVEIGGELRQDVAGALRELYRAEPSVEARAAVLRLLEKLGGAGGVEALADIVRADRAAASAALSRLSRLADASAGEELVRVIDTEEKRGALALSALRALGRTYDRRWVAYVAGLTNVVLEWKIRREAVDALGKFADPAALDALEPLLADANERVRHAAIRAVGLIQAPRSRALLEALSREELSVRERELVRIGLETQQGRRATTGPRR